MYALAFVIYITLPICHEIDSNDTILAYFWGSKLCKISEEIEIYQEAIFGTGPLSIPVQFRHLKIQMTTR